MIQLKENARTYGRTEGQTEGQKDGQTLFHRTLPATTRGPISNSGSTSAFKVANKINRFPGSTVSWLICTSKRKSAGNNFYLAKFYE